MSPLVGSQLPFVDQGDGTARIDLGRNCWALVDLADAEWLSRWKWHAIHPRKGAPRVYAMTSLRIDGRPSLQLMHRLILGLSRGDPREGDHINFDGLDNRRANLRIVSGLKNRQRRQRNAESYGAWFDKYARRGKGCWRAQARFGGKKYSIGWFATQEEAHKAALQWWAQRGVLDIAV